MQRLIGLIVGFLAFYVLLDFVEPVLQQLHLTLLVLRVLWHGNLEELGVVLLVVEYLFACKVDSESSETENSTGNVLFPLQVLRPKDAPAERELND